MVVISTREVIFETAKLVVDMKSRPLLLGILCFPIYVFILSNIWNRPHAILHQGIGYTLQGKW